VLTSDAVTSGDVLLVDASGFVANADAGVEFNATRQADVELQTSPREHGDEESVAAKFACDQVCPVVGLSALAHHCGREDHGCELLK
jgi:hypothetical protein